MASAAARTVEFELRSDDWLASVLERPAARVAFLKSDLPEVSDIRSAIETRRAKESSSEWQQRSLFVDAKVETAHVDQVQILSSLGMQVVDVNVTSELRSDRTTLSDLPEPSEIRIQRIESGCGYDHASVLDVASSAFRFSRFHLDPNIPNRQADAVKREWIHNALLGNRGDSVWIAMDGDRVVGFLSSVLASHHDKSSEEGIAVIDLIAVDPAAQGNGIGRHLTNAFFHHYKPRFNRFRVGTQVANLPALRLYQSMGFQPIASTYVFHGHFQLDECYEPNERVDS